MMAKSKKELDKDMLFSKIMPALTTNPFCADSHSEQEKAETSPNAISALRDKLFARSSSFIETETIATINVMETLVLKNVDEVIKRFNVCGCDRCRCDICAYALNILPARYVVVNPSKIEMVEAEIPRETIIAALIKAAIKVRAVPHH